MKAKDPNITQDYLRSILDYDPETGVFTRFFGKPVANKSDAKGYLRIYIAGRGIRAHRLAWFYVHGRWPEGQIDHINRIKSDNRIANLREADSTLQNINKPAALLRGVHCRKGGVFRSRIKIRGKAYYSPDFNRIEDASCWYWTMWREHHLPLLEK